MCTLYGDLQIFPNWCNIIYFFKIEFIYFKVTADGSVDCADNPGEQEHHLSRLHWCETISALLILSNGN